MLISILRFRFFLGLDEFLFYKNSAIPFFIFFGKLKKSCVKLKFFFFVFELNSKQQKKIGFSLHTDRINVFVLLLT